jgi:hypothetical protein
MGRVYLLFSYTKMKLIFLGLVLVIFVAVLSFTITTRKINIGKTEALFVRHNINEFREHGHLVHRADTRGGSFSGRTLLLN